MKNALILFVYNRPEHTRRTLEALSANGGVEQHPFIIFSDAPRTEVDQANVRTVRNLIRNTSGLHVHDIVLREDNWGLARSILSGVSDVLRTYDSVVVLEDDLVTSPFFLSFMQRALDIYKEDEKVMHVNGYTQPFDKTGLPQTFFTDRVNSWGWATWKRAWQHFDPDPDALVAAIRGDDAKHAQLNLGGAFNFFSPLKANAEGRIHTWAILWQTYIVLQEGLCLTPKDSLVQNIGNDNSGTNSTKTSVFDVYLADHEPSIEKNALHVNNTAQMRIAQFYRSIRPSFWQRFRNRFGI